MNVRPHCLRFLLPALAFCALPVHAQNLPDGDAKEIIERVCTGCHNTRRIISVKKTENEWQQTVDRMVDHGADLKTEEVPVLVAYLVKNFGKEDPAAKIGVGAPAKK